MKPQKFIRCGALIPVNDLRETLDFYRDVLGFYDEWTWGEVDGGIRRDDMRLLFGVDPAYVAIINNDKHHFTLTWIVDNIDSIHNEFTAKAIPLLRDIKTEPYGITEFFVKDINGYAIRIMEGSGSSH